MVRVLPVHHFTSQHVHTVDEPMAVAVVPPDRMLVALANHSVQVRDLAGEGRVTFAFPTVDKVQEIVYCAAGDYVATLESKPGRQKRVSLHARVYLGWDAEEACRQGTVVVRARIAGMVTPSPQQCNAPGVIEMVELPVKRTPTAIACSQLSGTIVVACHKSLSVYHQCTQTHSISRHTFLDFAECRFGLELSFAPARVEVCEDVLACMDAGHLQLFRLGDEQLVKQLADEQPAAGPGATAAAAQPPAAHSGTAGPAAQCKDYIDWEAVLQSKRPPSDFSAVLHPRSHPVLTDLPSVESQHESDSPAAHLQQSPFTSAAPFMPVNVKSGSPATMWTQGVQIAQLLQLRVNPVSPGGGGGDEFKCLVLKPYYKQHETSPQSDAACNPLRSSSYSSLVGIVCLVTLQQEGYFYFFPMAGGGAPAAYTDYNLSAQLGACICVYPFTAPVSAVALETSLLHALTETGLETYTTRSGHHLVGLLDKPDNKRTACPPASDPVFLVGLRPFLGCSSNVKHLELSRSHLVLLAYPETPANRASGGGVVSSQNGGGQNGSWTLYSLSLPAPHLLYGDFLSTAVRHRWTSPATYCHLLAEGHVMLRTLLTLDDKHTQRAMLAEQYAESCALLADFYLSGSEEESWEKAAPYYHMAGLTPLDVLTRLNQSPSSQPEGEEQETLCYVGGLLHYLRACLLQMNDAAQDVLFTPAVPALLHRLLDLVEVNAPAQLSGLVLRSQVLRECATDRLLALMKLQLRAKPYPEPADALSLALLCIQKDFPDQAVAVLSSIPKDDLTALLTAHGGLVLEAARDKRKSRQPLAMTELALVLVDHGPAALSRVLFNLIVADMVALQHVVQVFLELLPRMGAAGPVLQVVLEHYLAWYFTQQQQGGADGYDAPVAEALKMLVRSYLSDLQATQHSQPTSCEAPAGCAGGEAPLRPKVLFEECRPAYHSLLELTSVSRPPARVSPTVERRPQPTSLSLVKLQSLLSSGKLPPKCLTETHQFVESHPWTRGYLSLLVLCLPTKPAASIILDLCPEAVLEFCEDKFETNDDWRWLIGKLQQKIRAMEEDNFLKKMCLHLLTAVLTHLSQSLPLESLTSLLPPGEPSMQSYIRTCQEMSHASHINALLSATGHQLLSTLNL